MRPKFALQWQNTETALSDMFSGLRKQVFQGVLCKILKVFGLMWILLHETDKVKRDNTVQKSVHKDLEIFRRSASFVRESFFAFTPFCHKGVCT